MRYLFPVILTLLYSNISYAQIYKWTDNNGIVHFSDMPHPGSEIIYLPKTQTKAPSATEAIEAVEKAPAKINYEKLVISQPVNNKTIRNNQGLVTVIMALKPELAPGHLLQVIFDGAVPGKSQTGLSFVVRDVNRGTHTIAARIIDKEGKTVASSDANTFYMQRPRVGMIKRPIGG